MANRTSGRIPAISSLDRCERGYLGAAVSSWCVSSPKLLWPRILEPGPFFGAGRIKVFNTHCTDLLTHFLPASADANAAVRFSSWIGFSFKSNAENRRFFYSLA